MLPYSVSTPIDHANVHILPQTPQLIALLTSVPDCPALPQPLTPAG